MIVSGRLGKTIKVKLRDIKTDEDTFQWRKKGWEKTSEAQVQINDLMRHLRYTKEPLDPLVVYAKDDDKYVVIDGHHRLAAYEGVLWTKSIPAKVFQGSLEEAKQAAFDANDKGRRTYTPQERQDKAWDDTKRWFFAGKKGLSKEETARAAGVSSSTVGNMRRLIGERGEEVRDLTWAQALRGVKEHVPDPEWRKKKVRELKEAMLEIHVIKYAQSPDILAEAIEAISPTIPKRMVEYWTSLALEVAQSYELEDEERTIAVEAGLILPPLDI